MRYVYAVLAALLVSLAGCQTASVHDSHAGASVDQVGASSTTLETRTETPPPVLAVTAPPPSKPLWTGNRLRLTGRRI